MPPGPPSERAQVPLRCFVAVAGRPVFHQHVLEAHPSDQPPAYARKNYGDAANISTQKSAASDRIGKDERIKGQVGPPSKSVIRWVKAISIGVRRGKAIVLLITMVYCKNILSCVHHGILGALGPVNFTHLTAAADVRNGPLVGFYWSPPGVFGNLPTHTRRG